MIGPDEIRQRAEAEKINTSNVQRDYIFSWVLAGLYRQSRLAEVLTLKGGNLYRKAYFPETRFSKDLDFTTVDSVDPEFLESELKGICEYIAGQTGIRFDLDRSGIYDQHFIGNTKSAYKVRVYFQDFLGTKRQVDIRVDLDVAQLDKLYLEPVMTPLIHPYSDANLLATNVRAMRIEEALADKLKCLLQRRHSFDLFDLVYAIFINKSMEVDKSEVARVFLKKTIFEPSPGMAKNLLLGVPFDLMRDFWSSLVCPIGTLFDFEHALDLFNGGIEEIFAGFGPGYGSELAYYPAELRNKIMQAGADRKLMLILYKDEQRVIEPYSLKYQVTKDGSGREYFYAWDRSGGHNDSPSIKRFLNPNVQSLEILDETFEPRFEIEVAKAGELHGNINAGTRSARIATILGTPTPTPRNPSRRRTTALYSNLTRRPTMHIFACPRCGKLYYRQDRFNALIKPHKLSKYSRYNDCHGGFGRYQGRKN